MRAPIGEGRDRLLQALFDEFGESGPSPNLSMRQVAERLGVHHTLLTYHFGSRPALLGAVLSEARRRDNLVIAATEDQRGFEALFRAIWRFYSDDAHGDRIRAFFHLVGLSVYAPDDFQDFVGGLDELAGMLEAAARRDGLAPTEAKRHSLLAIACLRGLLLQRLLTPDADVDADVDAAAERFITTLTASIL